MKLKCLLAILPTLISITSPAIAIKFFMSKLNLQRFKTCITVEERKFKDFPAHKNVGASEAYQIVVTH